VTDPPIQP